MKNISSTASPMDPVGIRIEFRPMDCAFTNVV